jgi:tetratricopeptide (TPR) repeat protein
MCGRASVSGVIGRRRTHSEGHFYHTALARARMLRVTLRPSFPGRRTVDALCLAGLNVNGGESFMSLKAIALLLLLCGAAAAQGGGGAPSSNPDEGQAPGSIQGRVVLPNGSSISRPIKVSLRVLQGDKSVFYTDVEGVFDISKLTPGAYTLEIEPDKERNFEGVSERVQVYSRSSTFVTLYLKDGVPVKERRGADVVSTGELDRNVPAAAVKEFERGARAREDGRLEEAVAHLRKALAIYPDYLKARNDLGAYLLAQGRLEEASEELRKASEMDPKAFNPRLNLGIILIQQQKFREAADVLDRAMSLDPTSAAARLYAGVAHLGSGDGARAERELSAAYEAGGGQYALAQFYLGKLYAERGERALALRAFETYLRDKPDAANAEQVRRLIAALRQP